MERSALGFFTSNLNDCLGDTLQLTTDEVFNVVKVEDVGDQRQWVNGARLEQGDGVFEGVRVDEGPLNLQLLLEDLVGVNLEGGVRVTNTEHQHLTTTGSGFNGLLLGLWQTNGFNHDVVGVSLDFFGVLNVVDGLETEVLLVVLQLVVVGTSKSNFVDTTGLKDLSDQLTFETVTNDQSLLVWVGFKQVNPVFSTGNWFDYGSSFQRNVVRNVVNNFFRSSEVFFETTVTGNTNSIQVFTQFWTG